MAGVDFADFAQARLIVLWGVQPVSTGIHLMPLLKRAREAGAKLVVVDPRRTPWPTRVDLHLAVRPGTDLALALAVIRRSSSAAARTARSSTATPRGADELARAPRRGRRPAAAEAASSRGDPKLRRALRRRSPAVVRCGWGLERNRNGGSAVAAVLALPAVAGKFGVRRRRLHDVQRRAPMRVNGDERPAARTEHPQPST